MKHLTLILGLATLSTPALAAPISFTGAEFAALPGLTFPTGTQTIIADSLRIDATSGLGFLASLPLGQFNVDVEDFEVQIDITRLLRDDGVIDQAPFIYLSDGLNLFGGIFFDASSSATRTQARRDEIRSEGLPLIGREGFDQSAGTPVAINSNYLATIGVQATATNTTITTDINNGAVSSTGITTAILDSRNGGLSLTFAANSSSENYIINSVTFTRGVSTPTAVAEPGALGGMLLGLATLGFGLYRRRFG